MIRTPSFQRVQENRQTPDPPRTPAWDPLDRQRAGKSNTVQRGIAVVLGSHAEFLGSHNVVPGHSIRSIIPPFRHRFHRFVRRPLPRRSSTDFPKRNDSRHGGRRPASRYAGRGRRSRESRGIRVRKAEKRAIELRGEVSPARREAAVQDTTSRNAGDDLESRNRSHFDEATERPRCKSVARKQAPERQRLKPGLRRFSAMAANCSLRSPSRVVGLFMPLPNACWTLVFFALPDGAWEALR